MGSNVLVCGKGNMSSGGKKRTHTEERGGNGRPRKWKRCNRIEKKKEKHFPLSRGSGSEKWVAPKRKITCRVDRKKKTPGWGS